MDHVYFSREPVEHMALGAFFLINLPIVSYYEIGTAVYLEIARTHG
jgi:hypothetical protein